MATAVVFFTDQDSDESFERYSRNLGYSSTRVVNTTQDGWWNEMKVDDEDVFLVKDDSTFDHVVRYLQHTYPNKIYKYAPPEELLGMFPPELVLVTLQKIEDTGEAAKILSERPDTWKYIRQLFPGPNLGVLAEEVAKLGDEKLLDHIIDTSGGRRNYVLGEIARGAAFSNRKNILEKYASRAFAGALSIRNYYKEALKGAIVGMHLDLVESIIPKFGERRNDEYDEIEDAIKESVMRNCEKEDIAEFINKISEKMKINMDDITLYSIRNGCKVLVNEIFFDRSFIDDAVEEAVIGNQPELLEFIFDQSPEAYHKSSIAGRFIEFAREKGYEEVLEILEEYYEPESESDSDW